MVFASNRKAPRRSVLVRTPARRPFSTTGSMLKSCFTKYLSASAIVVSGRTVIPDVDMKSRVLNSRKSCIAASGVGARNDDATRVGLPLHVMRPLPRSSGEGSRSFDLTVSRRGRSQDREGRYAPREGDGRRPPGRRNGARPPAVEMAVPL